MNLQKIFFIFLLSFLTSGLFAQKKDTSDYFALGLYGGAFIAQGPMHSQNDIINSAAIEVEYFKMENLSFYLQGLYEFGESSYHRYPVMMPDNFSGERYHEPDNYTISVTIGGRYYLRSRTVNPFLQFGINHETNYAGNNFYPPPQPGLLNTGEHFFRGGYSAYNISLNPGAGVSFKLSDKFKAELKYDLYIGIVNSRNQSTAYSILGGLKYNF